MKDLQPFLAHLDPTTQFLRLGRPFELECGEKLFDVEVAYRTWGDPRNARHRAVLVCHALTGSADVDRWWDKVLGPGRALDPRRDFILAQATLGSCYGTTGPTSLRPAKSGQPRRAWGPEFPPITIRDQVRLQLEVLTRLGLERLQLVVGGSLGGMQALEWALLAPDRVEAVAALAAPARHGPWAIALSELGRQALALDPHFQNGWYDPGKPPRGGLELARQVAMVSYRSPESLEIRFGRNKEGESWAVTSWLAHHGRRLADRFDANTYLTLLGAMDSHDLGRGRGGWEAALARIRVPVWILAISSDCLYPIQEIRAVARGIPRAREELLESPHGHDAFLIEQQRVERSLARFREEVTRASVDLKEVLQ